MLDILVICGSLRRDSYNMRIAEALATLGLKNVRFSMSPQISEIPLYNQDSHDDVGVPPAVMSLAEAIRAAAGVVIVSPEYNWSIPGALKNAIDWLSRLPNQPFKRKPVAIQSSSSGVLGGSRMQYHLRQVLACVEADVFGKPEVIVTYAKTKFDERGVLTDQSTRVTIERQIEKFVEFILCCGK